MSILKIARMGHPVLGVPAEEVTDPTSRAVRRLIEDMVETMIDSNGVGLAAPQVHVGLRVLVFHAPAERNDGDEENVEEDDSDRAAAPLTVLINPEIEPLTEEKVLGWEGCLSVPDMTGAVRRFSHIRYRGLTPAGQEIVREARGFHARVVQHECDHLDGILYPHRIEDITLFGFAEEIGRSLAMAEEAEERGKDGDDDDAAAAE